MRDALEQAELAAPFAAHRGVTAERASWFVPEMWEDTIDGRSPYFRERHGEWHTEIDLAPDGTHVQRWVGRGDNGEMIAEPAELTSSPETVRGAGTDLGADAAGDEGF